MINKYTARRRQAGAASIEYVLVIMAAVAMLVMAPDGTNPLALLAKALISFYADFSFAISLATP